MSFIPQDVGTTLSMQGGARQPVHPAGTFAGVCVDVINLGTLPTPWGPKRKIRLVFETSEAYQDESTGEWRPFLLSQTFTASLSDGANLRAFLETWRGKSFSEEELQGYELERLVGANCLLSIVVDKGKKGEFAKINGAAAPMKGMPILTPSGNYTRVKDRSVADQEKFYERVHSQNGPQPVAATPAPAARNLGGRAPVGHPSHRTGQVPLANYEDFVKPGALKAEDDDLPF